MIVQVVFDLPLDGPFDYLVPEHLTLKMLPGVRVKVSFGPKTQIGYVVGLLNQSDIPKLKPVLAVLDASAVFSERDLIFAKVIGVISTSNILLSIVFFILVRFIIKKSLTTPPSGRSGLQWEFRNWSCSSPAYQSLSILYHISMVLLLGGHPYQHD